MSEGRYRDAVREYDAAIRLRPDHADDYNGRGFAWHMHGIGADDRPACEDRALADYAEAIRLDPGYASARNNRAWLWATSRVDRCRNGTSAVEEAREACRLTNWANAGYLDTLSVALAEVGDFAEATRWQRRALEDPVYAAEEAENARAKLALFAARRPFRE